MIRSMLEVLGVIVIVYFLLLHGPETFMYIEQHGMKAAVERLWEGPK